MNLEKKQSKLLTSDHYLQFSPVTSVILNDSQSNATIFQQVYYWTQKYKNDPSHQRVGKDGVIHTWIFNTYDDWQLQFPWLSTRTIRRCFDYLEKKKLLLSDNFNFKPTDQTKWYTVNDDAVTILREMYKKLPQNKKDLLLKRRKLFKEK